VRQKWLSLYGTTFRHAKESEESRDDFGGGYNKYEGNHFGK
jgi:iron complex outermembrane receptor protein